MVAEEKSKEINVKCRDAKYRFIVLNVVLGNQKISKKVFCFFIGELDFGGK